MDIDSLITGFKDINIFLGKNGSGKSTILRNLKKFMESNQNKYYVSYVVPERGGQLVYESGIENAIVRDNKWASAQRNTNQLANFKVQTIGIYNDISTYVSKELRKLVVDGIRDDTLLQYTFDRYLKVIQSLLDNIELVEENRFLKFVDKTTKQPIPTESISSGESELICLGIEILAFFLYAKEGFDNYLLLDEPDIHLHPDLQVRLVDYLFNLKTEFSDKSVKIIIATHSTSFVGGLEGKQNCKLYFIQNKEIRSEIESVGDMHKKILPIFGAHPLSQIFNNQPIIIVEGENDEIIIQQMVKSSQGKIKLYPCVAGSEPRIKDYEREASNIMNAIYDDAKGYSLRDGDGVQEELEDIGSITRIRLKCYEMENILLSDELLEKYETNWELLKGKLTAWVDANYDHEDVEDVKGLLSTGDRKNHKISEYVNIIASSISKFKPRPFLIGQTLGQLSCDDHTDFTKDGSIYDFLGEKFVKNILTPKV